MAWPKGKPRKAQDVDKAKDDTSELVTYLPRSGDPETTKWRGVEFKANVPTRITDKAHIEAARNNSFFRVGNNVNEDVPNGPPTDAMEYRGHVLGWVKDVATVEQLVKAWAQDRDVRLKCEIGHDDISFLGTLIEPKLRMMRLSEGLNETQVAELWMRYGIFDLPWRA
jgi:hypothetical protein